ncbi:hypothetical protein ACGE24_07950 [Corynebacterium kroppenstedtii]|uniref:hypothetical protein n=1 Tax=Corynebacterium sp. PCR 32 TaxID=3351342 RepID=UPI0030958926
MTRVVRLHSATDVNPVTCSGASPQLASSGPGEHHHAPTRRTRMTKVFSGAIAVAAVLVAPIVSSSSAVAHAAPTPNIDQQGNIIAPIRTQISFQESLTGFHAGTTNEHESRPALSLVKMYIADYVFEHGTPEEQAQATQMLRYSDDNIATALYKTYPQSIQDRAEKYHLNDTHADPRWGYSTTSTADSVAYLEAKKRENLSGPVLVALATASPVAADGFKQDYGTATLPGVIGTKWGWSDDRKSITASASFGPFFSVSANTYGPAQQLTDDVHTAFTHNPATPPATDNHVSPAADPSPAAQTEYPARAASQAALNDVRAATDNVLPEHIIETVGQPLVNAVPKTVTLPAPLAAVLPPAPQG